MFRNIWHFFFPGKIALEQSVDFDGELVTYHVHTFRAFLKLRHPIKWLFGERIYSKEQAEELRQWMLNPQRGAISFTQGTTVSASSTLAFASNTTTGHLIVASTRLFPTAAFTSFSDTRSDSYSTVFQTAVGSSDHDIILGYAKNITGGSCTVSVNATTIGSIRMGIAEISGCDTTAPLDKSTSATSTGTTADSGNVTTTVADEILVGVATNSSGVDFSSTTPTGWSFVGTGSVDGKFVMKYKIVSSTGTYNFAPTLLAGDTYGSGIATFKIASGGGGTTTTTFFPFFDKRQGKAP